MLTRITEASEMVEFTKIPKKRLTTAAFFVNYSTIYYLRKIFSLKLTFSIKSLLLLIEYHFPDVSWETCILGKSSTVICPVQSSNIVSTSLLPSEKVLLTEFWHDLTSIKSSVMGSCNTSNVAGLFDPPPWIHCSCSVVTFFGNSKIYGSFLSTSRLACSCRFSNG